MTGSYSAEKNLPTKKYSPETRTWFFEKDEYAGWPGRTEIEEAEGPEETDCSLTGPCSG